VYDTLGCHPHKANQWDSSSPNKLEKAIKTLRPELVALGECGLDYSGRNNVPKEQHQKAFKQQVTGMDK
jgi:TatD DNase family protein